MQTSGTRGPSVVYTCETGPLVYDVYIHRKCYCDINACKFLFNLL
jgi:hypothetical protein